MAPRLSSLLNGRVVAALLLQTAGYAALLALFPHSSPTDAVGVLAGVPDLILIPLAIPAVPATVLTVVVGAVLGAVGLPPASIPAILLARGDVLFFLSALVVAVVAARADERVPDVT